MVVWHFYIFKEAHGIKIRKKTKKNIASVISNGHQWNPSSAGNSCVELESGDQQGPSDPVREAAAGIR